MTDDKKTPAAQTPPNPQTMNTLADGTERIRQIFSKTFQLIKEKAPASKIQAEVAIAVHTADALVKSEGSVKDFIQVFAANLTDKEIEELVLNPDTPGSLQQILMPYVQQKLQLRGAKVKINEGFYNPQTGLFDETKIRGTEAAVAREVLNTIVTSTDALAKFGNISDVDKRLAIMARHALDPDHNPLPENFRPVNFAELQNRVQAEQADAQLNNYLGALQSYLGIKGRGLTPNDVAEAFKSDAVPKALEAAGYRQNTVQYNTAIDLLRKYVESGAASANLTSSQAAAFSAWPKSIVEFGTAAWSIVSTVGMTLLGIVGGKYALGWLKENWDEENPGKDWFKAHPTLGKLKNIFDGLGNPIVGTFNALLDAGSAMTAPQQGASAAPGRGPVTASAPASRPGNGQPTGARSTANTTQPGETPPVQTASAERPAGPPLSREAVRQRRARLAGLTPPVGANDDGKEATTVLGGIVNPVNPKSTPDASVG